MGATVPRSAPSEIGCRCHDLVVRARATIQRGAEARCRHHRRVRPRRAAVGDHAGASGPHRRASRRGRRPEARGPRGHDAVHRARRRAAPPGDARQDAPRRRRARAVEESEHVVVTVGTPIDEYLSPRHGPLFDLADRLGAAPPTGAPGHPPQHCVPRHDARAGTPLRIARRGGQPLRTAPSESRRDMRSPSSTDCPRSSPA